MKRKSRQCRCPLPKPELLFATNKANVDYCKNCKRKIVTKKDVYTGRINNREYAETHKIDILQPHGKDAKLFEKEYGKPDNFLESSREALNKAKAISDERTEQTLADIDREESSSNRNLF